MLCMNCEHYFELKYEDHGGISRCLIIRDYVKHVVHMCTHFKDRKDTINNGIATQEEIDEYREYLKKKKVGS